MYLQSSSSLGYNRSPRPGSADPSCRPIGHLQSPNRPAATTFRATADIYDSPSDLDAQTPPPAYDVGVLSTGAPRPNTSGSSSTTQPHSTARSPPGPDENWAPNARRSPRGPRRPLAPIRSNSEFIPYSVHYYFIHADDEDPLDHPTKLDHRRTPATEFCQHPPAGSSDPPAPGKRKANKLRKPRPVPPHLIHQAKVNEVHRQPDVYQNRPPIHRSLTRPPLTNAARTNGRNLKLTNWIRPRDPNTTSATGPPTEAETSMSQLQHQSSRQLRDEKRLAQVNPNPAPEMPSNRKICLHCQWGFSNQTHLNFHINLNHHSLRHPIGIHHVTNGRSFFT